MNSYWGPFRQQPNLLIFLTDQQRTAQYLPQDWVQNNLPNLWALMQGGVHFPNAMTNTVACSPSRATLWTSTFPMINGVDSTGATLNMKDNLTTLGLALAHYAPANFVRSGDLVLTLGTFTLSGHRRDGTPLERTSRFADVLRRQPDGRWLVAVDNGCASD